MAIAKLHPFGVVTIGVALATVGLWGQQQNRVPAGDRSAVTQADVERWKQELTNWGRLGSRRRDRHTESDNAGQADAGRGPRSGVLVPSAVGGVNVSRCKNGAYATFGIQHRSQATFWL